MAARRAACSVTCASRAGTSDWTSTGAAWTMRDGTLDASRYRFPFENAAFDVAYAASLFTHLLPEETQNYFREAHRVVKPGGSCLFSFFVLDHYRGQGTTVSPMYEFTRPLPGHSGVAVRDLEHPDAVIAYSSAVIESYAGAAGLRVERLLPGYWSDSPGLAVNEQDLIVLRRA
jgi:SAM-dependent methyltransferase